MADVIIRPSRLSDAGELHSYVIDPAVARGLYVLPSMEVGETEKWLENMGEDSHRLVAEVDGRAVGNAGIGRLDAGRRAHAGRLGISVAREHWGQGIGTALMAALMDLADNWLNLGRVELGVMADNARAIRLYERFGFEHEVTRRDAGYGDGRWADELTMARLRPWLTAQPAAEAGPLPPRAGGPLASIVVRPARPPDIGDLHEMRRHPAVARTTNRLPSEPVAAVARRFGEPRAGAHRLVAEVERRAIGIAEVHQMGNPRVAHMGAVGMMVHPDYWGRGVGSALMAAVVDLADNWLNLRRLELDVMTDNPAGIRLYEKFGFRPEGVCRYATFGAGNWHNHLFMARLRERR